MLIAKCKIINDICIGAYRFLRTIAKKNGIQQIKTKNKKVSGIAKKVSVHHKL